jgi:AcrR family transcriptional regulator
MTTVSVTDSSRPVRKDVARNRALLLAAGEELVTARGTEVTLDDIARHAGLGVGTAYRHFANKRALIAALLEDRMEQVLASALEAQANPDPGAGLAAFLTDMGERQARDRGLREVLASDQNEELLSALRKQLLPLIDDLVARAQATGQLRQDMTANDVGMIITILGSFNDRAGEHAPSLWRRYLDVLLAGFAGPTVPQRLLGEPAPPTSVVEKVITSRPRGGLLATTPPPD